MVQDRAKWIGNRSSRRNSRLNVTLLQADQVNEIVLEPPVERSVPGVVVRVGPPPAVMLNARVKRLRRVSDVMTEPADVERRVLFGKRSWLVVSLLLAPGSERHLQPLVDLHRRVGQHAG